MSLTRTLLCGSIAVFGFMSNKMAAQNTNRKPIPTKITVTLPKSLALDTLRLFEWEGIQIKEAISIRAKSTKNNITTFDFGNKSYAEGVYFIGKDLQDLKPIVIGKDKEINLSVQANEKPFQTAKVINSPNNTYFVNALDSISLYNNLFAQYLQTFATNQNTDKEKASIAVNQLQALDTRKKEYLNQLKKQAPNVEKIAALYTYLSYPNNKRSENEKEAQYFAETYYQFTNLADSFYFRTPHFFESMKVYGATIFSLNLPRAEVIATFDKLLAKIPKQSPQYKVALLSLAFSAIGKDNSIFFLYGSKYKEEFTGFSPELDPYLAQELAKARGPLEAGMEAPDFTELTPEGKPLKLSDLRGKVVLIDFWASWCGPCRRENPHVVKLYEKYKDKGFEILGVSLDRDRDRWLQAIKDDKLTWPQVSDLQHWQSKAAKLYNVTGIPYTVLLDANGNIIATKLRGEALDAALQNIFGF